MEGIEDEERRSGSLVDGERPVTDRIVDARTKNGYDRIIMPAYVFDLGWAQLDSAMFAEPDGPYERDNVLAATQLNGKPNAAEDVISNEVVLSFKPATEIPGVKPVVTPFDSKVSRRLTRTVDKVLMLLYERLDASSR